MSGASVLHVLSQRPSLTGSGVTLDALVRHADRAGWDQHAVVGIPAEERGRALEHLPADRVHPVLFGDGGDLPFPVPGMSDVMPYASTRFGAMDEGQLDAYRDTWRRHLERVVEEVRPAVIHAHHLWIVASLLREVAPGVPVVSHSHATGLRQMELCPAAARAVRESCRRLDRFAVLHRGHARLVAGALGVPRERIAVVGAGYREELFHCRGRAEDVPPRLLYVGKFAAAKGLPWLLDAFEELRRERPGLELHVAGAGGGMEGEELARRMADLAPAVRVHGMLDQPRLAEVMRCSTVCVLPSFYEGLPLVLVEALACGCRLVATDLPGVAEELAPHLGEALEVVPLPRLERVDRPVAADQAAFTANLARALRRALDASPLEPDPDSLAPFTWGAVFARVETLWRALLAGEGGPQGA